MHKFGITMALLAILFTAVPGQGPKESTSPLSLPITSGNNLIDGYVTEAAEKYNLDPLILYAQIFQESSNRRKALSPKGAQGLMQLMPGTARRFGAKNPYNAKQNIFAGARYMRWLLDTFDGDLELALAGYNAGEGAVMKYGNEIPPYRETKNYVKNVMSKYLLLQDQQKELASL